MPAAEQDGGTQPEALAAELSCFQDSGDGKTWEPFARPVLAHSFLS
jgi:hypothetical protein